MCGELLSELTWLGAHKGARGSKFTSRELRLDRSQTLFLRTRSQERRFLDSNKVKMLVSQVTLVSHEQCRCCGYLVHFPRDLTAVDKSYEAWVIQLWLVGLGARLLDIKKKINFYLFAYLWWRRNVHAKVCVVCVCVSPRTTCCSWLSPSFTMLVWEVELSFGRAADTFTCWTILLTQKCTVLVRIWTADFSSVDAGPGGWENDYGDDYVVECLPGRHEDLTSTHWNLCE